MPQTQGSAELERYLPTTLDSLMAKIGDGLETRVNPASVARLLTIVNHGAVKVIVPLGQQKAYREVLPWIAETSAQRCGLTVGDVVGRLDRQHDVFPPYDRLTDLIDDIYDIVWLDKRHLWFWVRNNRDRLVRQALMALSLVRRISIADLRKRLDRWYRHVHGEPLPHPKSALLELLRFHGEHCFIDDEIVHASNDLKPVGIMNENPERAILKAFVEAGPGGLIHQEVYKRCCRLDMPENRFRKLLDSLAFVDCREGLYSLAEKQAEQDDEI